MTESFASSSEKAGLPPGSLIHVGKVLETETCISVVTYNKETLQEHELQSMEEILEHKHSGATTWVIIEGLKNIDIVEGMGKIFNIHRLVLEDILNTHQRPKFEEYDNCLYMVLKSMSTNDELFHIHYEQISILLLDNMVIVFKEKQDSLFAPLLKNLKRHKGQLRNHGADYLTYAILDAIVDQYFNITDSLDEAIAPLEESLLASELNHNVLTTIQRLKREIIHVRRYVSPVRELVAEMLRSGSPLINEKTYLYLRDVSDHTLRVMESIESYRDILTGLMEIYMSGVSNKMNEVMKVLTIFASIFIPLTFIAGIYGMNFQFMPELKWKWAYPALWGVFIAIPVVLLIYFKRKKWL